MQTADRETQDHSPPHSIDAELAVIGSVLIDPAMMSTLLWLPETAFYRDLHSAIWRLMLDLAKAGDAVDMVTVSDAMDRQRIDGVDELMRTVNAVSTSANAQNYAAIVNRCWQQRRIGQLASRLMKAAYDQSDPVGVCQRAMEHLAMIAGSSPGDRTGRRTYAEVLEALDADTDQRIRFPDQTLRTGYTPLDVNGGFEPGQLILIAARPGVGKSAIGLAVARQVAGYMHHIDGGTVEYFTMEMTALAQARRLVASRAEPTLDTLDIRSGFRTAGYEDAEAYAAFMSAMAQEGEDVGDDLGFHEGSLTTDEMAARLTQIASRRRVRLVVVDYLDLFSDTNREGESARLSSISLKLKRLAVRLKLPIICLVQLNRDVEDRADHRPMLSDLRMTGRLEQDADAVFGLYRPSMHFPADDNLSLDARAAYLAWTEIITLKYRDGKRGYGPLYFLPEAATFIEWDKYHWPLDKIIPIVRNHEKAGKR